MIEVISETNEGNETTYDRAVKLLKRFDKRKRGLRLLEMELDRLAVQVGRDMGCYGYTKDHLRIYVHNQERFNKSKQDAA